MVSFALALSWFRQVMGSGTRVYMTRSAASRTILFPKTYRYIVSCIGDTVKSDSYIF
jgi:hypothetical protein